MKWYPKSQLAPFIYLIKKMKNFSFFLPHPPTRNDENNSYLERKGLFNFEIEYHRIVGKADADVLASPMLVLKMLREKRNLCSIQLTIDASCK